MSPNDAMAEVVPITISPSIAVNNNALIPKIIKKISTKNIVCLITIGETTILSILILITALG